jgi:hypothetical protein
MRSLTWFLVAFLVACSAPTPAFDDDDGSSEDEDLTTGTVSSGPGVGGGTAGAGGSGGSPIEATGGGGSAPVGWSHGALVISEIMNNPAAVTDEFGEWFEIYNTTAAALDLDGVRVLHQPGDPIGVVIEATVIVPPGGYVVLGRNADTSINGGVMVDYVFGPEVNLNNTYDYLAIEAPDGTLIDETAWDELSGLDPDGASRTLDAANLSATMNDDDANFCEATTWMPSGDYGTPGAPNDMCP